MRIAPGICRIGDSSIINAYLVEEENEVTVVDARSGRPVPRPPPPLASMGRTIADVRALGLTPRCRDKKCPATVCNEDTKCWPTDPD